MSFYNTAALYGGCGLTRTGMYRAGKKLNDDDGDFYDYEGGWNIAQGISASASPQALADAGAHVIKTAGLTERQQLLIRWWQTPEGGNHTLGAINLAFGLVFALDSIRAAMVQTAPGESKMLLAARYKTIKENYFGTKGAQTPGQKQTYALYLKAAKMIHRKLPYNKLKARKWMIDTNKPYVRGTWYKALPAARAMNPDQIAAWGAKRQKANDALENWQAFYEAHRSPTPYSKKKKARAIMRRWKPTRTSWDLGAEPNLEDLENILSSGAPAAATE